MNDAFLLQTSDATQARRRRQTDHLREFQILQSTIPLERTKYSQISSVKMLRHPISTFAAFAQSNSPEWEDIAIKSNLLPDEEG